MDDATIISCTEPARQMERAIAVMRRLREPGGCPWDAEQTHESIVSNLLEEAYECADAIRSGDDEHMREELGDVLLQVIFHAQMAAERGVFDLNEVAAELSEKLIRRHPHVFALSEVSDTDGVLNQWDAIKRVEKKLDDTKSHLHGCGQGLPALMRTQKLSAKAAKVGFDWTYALETHEKVAEELAEVAECLHAPEQDLAHLEEELGDLLFSVVNLCRKCEVDAELALSAANEKFLRRFHGTELRLRDQGLSLQEATLDQMEDCWQQVKKEE